MNFLENTLDERKIRVTPSTFILDGASLLEQAQGRQEMELSHPML